MCFATSIFNRHKAFAMNHYTMKPFEGNPEKDSIERIFNYRFSRPRRVVENAFEVLSSVFRVLFCWNQERHQKLYQQLYICTTFYAKASLHGKYIHHLERSILTRMGNLQRVDGGMMMSEQRYCPYVLFLAEQQTMLKIYVFIWRRILAQMAQYRGKLIIE